MNDIERRLRDLGDRAAQEVTYRQAPRRRIVRRARMRRAAIVAAPVAAAVLFAAVAYPRLDSSDEQRLGVPVSVDLAAAAAATEDAGSARMEMSIAMEFGEQTITMNGEGEIDFDDSRSYFRVTGDDSTVYGVGGEFEIISIGRTMFQRAVGDPKWAKSEVDVPAGSAAFGTGPDELFTYLESVFEDVTSLGEEVLDGVPVTHLRATVDTTALEEMSRMPSGGYEYEPFDIWIDEANRVRKTTFGGSFEGPGASSSGTMSMTMRFWDFGVPVDVAAPSPEDVTDEPPESWAGLFGGEAVESDVSTGGDVTMIMGERDVEEPYVEVDTQDPSLVEICAYSAKPVTSARLVHRPSGRLVFLFDPVRSDGHFHGPTQVACVEASISPADVEDLIDEPTEFTLHVQRRDGKYETVELSQTAESLGGDVAGE